MYHPEEENKQDRTGAECCRRAPRANRGPRSQTRREQSSDADTRRSLPGDHERQLTDPLCPSKAKLREICAGGDLSELNKSRA
eukprot:121424-Hanusia_phi.AAC.1